MITVRLRRSFWRWRNRFALQTLHDLRSGALSDAAAHTFWDGTPADKVAAARTLDVAIEAVSRVPRRTNDQTRS